MDLVETRYEHVALNTAGVPVIEGTTMKVVELVLEKLAYGWSAEELHFQHPYLSMGQVYSALAYYWDHKSDLDQEIAQRLVTVDQLRARHQPHDAFSALKARPPAPQ